MKLPLVTHMISDRRRILIVDDHPILREGLRGLIDQQSDLSVCGEASTIEGALQVLRESAPDAMTVDISLGKESGLDLINQARGILPELAILVLSMHTSDYAERALRGGLRLRRNRSAQVIRPCAASWKGECS